MLYLIIYLIIGFSIGVAGVITYSIRDGFKPSIIAGGAIVTVVWFPMVVYYLIKIRD